MTNTILTFVLGMLAVLGAVFTLQDIIRTHELRALQVAIPEKNYLLMVQAIANDAMAYNQKYPNPELTQLLQQVQAKPATR